MYRIILIIGALLVSSNIYACIVCTDLACVYRNFDKQQICIGVDSGVDSGAVYKDDWLTPHTPNILDKVSRALDSMRFNERFNTCFNIGDGEQLCNTGDTSKFNKLFRSARHGDVEAQYSMYMFLTHGESVEVMHREELALKYLEAVANSENSSHAETIIDANLALARRCFNDDQEKAVKYIEKAANLGDPEALFILYALNKENGVKGKPEFELIKPPIKLSFYGKLDMGDKNVSIN